MPCATRSFGRSILELYSLQAFKLRKCLSDAWGRPWSTLYIFYGEAQQYASSYQKLALAAYDMSSTRSYSNSLPNLLPVGAVLDASQHPGEHVGGVWSVVPVLSDL